MLVITFVATALISPAAEQEMDGVGAKDCDAAEVAKMRDGGRVIASESREQHLRGAAVGGSMPEALELWKLTNETRVKTGLPELLWDDSLAAAAKAHAKDMAVDGYFSHESYDRQNGQLVATRSAQERITSFSASGCAENIAQGHESAEQVIASWMASDGHRSNILANSHLYCGTAFYGGYWVQVFGR